MNIFILILKTVSVTKKNYCFPVNGEWQEEDAFLLTMLTEYEEQLLASRNYHFIRTFRSSMPDVPHKEWYQSESLSKFVQSEGYQNSGQTQFSAKHSPPSTWAGAGTGHNDPH